MNARAPYSIHLVLLACAALSMLLAWGHLSKALIWYAFLGAAVTAIRAVFADWRCMAPELPPARRFLNNCASFSVIAAFPAGFIASLLGY